MTTKYWTPYDKFVYQVNVFQFFPQFHKLLGTNIYISVVKWQTALQLPNQFLSLKMVPKIAISNPIKLKNTKILMENTI